MKLCLFDIDGTIFSWRGLGANCVSGAMKDLCGLEVDGRTVSFAGSLDPVIYADLARAHNLPLDQHERYRELYSKRLFEALERTDEQGRGPRLLDGVTELLAAMDQRAAATCDVTMGLLTGNYPETGMAKIRRLGIDVERFRINAWGDDGQVRADLPPAAMRRFEEHFEQSIAPQDVVIIGDTPRDVQCAHANGCRAIAVATGPFSVEDLEATGADLAVPNLTATAQLMEWIF